MAGTGKIKVNDSTLYQLLEVEQQFGISRIKLIEFAAKESSEIRLCILVPVGSESVVIDIASTNGVQPIRRGGVKLPMPNKSDAPQKLIHYQKVVALVVSPKTCDEIMMAGIAKQSVFMEAYITENSAKNRRKKLYLEKPNRYHQSNLSEQNLSLIDPSRWRFATYPSTISYVFDERRGYPCPNKLDVSRDNLCIFGIELKRFMEKSGMKVSVSKAQSHDQELDAVTRGKMAFSVLAAEIKKRAIAKGEFSPPPWPGIEIDVVALANIWGPLNSHPILKNKPSTLLRYRRGIISFDNGSRSSDFYLNIFPEHAESIIECRNKLKIESEKRKNSK